MMKMLQDELEIGICSETVRRLQPKAVLEIGSEKGGTLSVWLKLGVPHVVSLDVNHSQLDRQGLEAVRAPHQTLTLITGDSRQPETIARLDATMKELGIEQFDMSYIDGAHDYLSVKADFATCLTRTSALVIVNDPVLLQVGQFLDELTRARHTTWKWLNVINPNRRLPSAGTHTCGSDYLAETGGGNFLLFVSDRVDAAYQYARDRVARELVPSDPAFQPTRSYFHQRGIRESPEYAAYWSGLYPAWGLKGHWRFGEAVSWYRRSYEEQMRGEIEQSLRLARIAERARRRWIVSFLKYRLRPLKSLLTRAER